MTKEEIYAVLDNQKSTVLSFPERGPWGLSSFRGNCSGYVPAYFIRLYNAKSVAEIFAGSGTTYDICKNLEIRYRGIDLNPNPTRDGIISMDILDETRDLPDEFYNSDMLFLHPPYPSINDIHYANSMWKGSKELEKRDIQNMSWDKGMNAVNKAVMRGYAAMQPGAYEVILVGEIRSKGQYRSMFQSLCIPGILHQTFIKLQHNTVSGFNNKNYGKSDFALTGHEMIAVIKKPSGYEIAYVIPRTIVMDIRDSLSATWKDVVAAAMRNIGRPATHEQIYSEVGKFKRCQQNPYWKDKVRQVLNSFDMFRTIEPGLWAMVA